MFIEYSVLVKTNNSYESIDEIAQFEAITFDPDYNLVIISLTGYNDICFVSSYEDYCSKIFYPIKNALANNCSILSLVGDVFQIYEDKEFSARSYKEYLKYTNYNHELQEYKGA